MNTNEALYTYTLRLADDALIMGHRLAEWCSKAPFLEEDLALTNFSLDLIGRAQALLSYAAQIENKGRTYDDLAYKRGEREFYNHLITELPNGNFAFTMAKLFLFSTYEIHVYEVLVKSHDETIAAIAAKTLKEIKYHQKHASNWILRLGDGTKESHSKMQDALNQIWMFTGNLFEMDNVDHEMLKKNIGVNFTEIKTQWLQTISKTINEATLTMPNDEYMQTGSKQGIHTENLGYILAEMQYLQRAYPNAKW